MFASVSYLLSSFTHLLSYPHIHALTKTFTKYIIFFFFFDSPFIVFSHHFFVIDRKKKEKDHYVNTTLNKDREKEIGLLESLKFPIVPNFRQCVSA